MCNGTFIYIEKEDDDVEDILHIEDQEDIV